jgi:hypothetical protein
MSDEIGKEKGQINPNKRTHHVIPCRGRNSQPKGDKDT